MSTDYTEPTFPVRQRAIDIYEEAICAVIDLCFYGNDLCEDVCYDVALHTVAREWSLRPERLDQLVRCWCGIAGIEVPA